MLILLNSVISTWYTRLLIVWVDLAEILESWTGVVRMPRQRPAGNGLQAVSRELGLAPVVLEPLEVVCLHNCLFSQHLLSPFGSVVLKKESKNLLLRW